MSFPQQVVAPKSELSLGSIVQLMQIAADSPSMDYVAVQSTAEHRQYLGCLKPASESTFDFAGRRRLRVNELCKEALPYVTRIYEIQEERDAAKREAAQMERSRDKAQRQEEAMRRLLYQYAPQLFEDYDHEFTE